ncbi:hypothetical protein HK101_003548 [Irineochytrium annulatum]|nr:hypothetical protein HK101_003548 [Irineochytrium annulatum]
MSAPFFGGDFKTKRNINLAGASASTRVDKSTLIQQAQLERQRREHERLRQRSALRVQSWFRARSDHVKLKARLRDRWEMEFAGGGDTIELMRLYLQFNTAEFDDDRFCRFGELLLRESDGILHESERGLQVSLLGVPWSLLPFLNPTVDVNTWRYRIRKFLRVCARNMRSPGTVAVSLKLVLSMTGVDSCSRTGQMNLREDLIGDLVKNGKLYDALKTFFETLWPFNHVGYLSILKKNDFGNSSIRSLRSLSQSRFFATDGKVFHDVCKSPRDRGGVLSNLVAFAQQWIPRMDAGRISSSFFIALDRALDPTPETEWFNDEDEEMETVITPSYEHTIFTDDERARKWIVSIFQTDHIVSVLRFLFTSEKSLEIPLSVCDFLIMLVRKWPSKKQEVLRTILFKSPQPIIPRLVHLLKTTALWPLNNGVKSYAQTLQDMSLRSYWVMMELTCEAVSIYLQMLGDDEFFNVNKFLPLGDIIMFSSILREVSFFLQWSDCPPEFESIKTLFTKTLQQIHIRDSRRQFCPPGHWIMVKDKDMDSFVQLAVVDEEEAMAGNSRVIQSISGPRQAILDNMPFLIPFDSRVKIFRQWIQKDRESEMINPKWLRIFNQQELQILLGGASVPIDLNDLRDNVTYGGDFHDRHPTMVLFWDVVDKFTEEEKGKLIKPPMRATYIALPGEATPILVSSDEQAVFSSSSILTSADGWSVQELRGRSRRCNGSIVLLLIVLALALPLTRLLRHDLHAGEPRPCPVVSTTEADTRRLDVHTEGLKIDVRDAYARVRFERDDALAEPVMTYHAHLGEGVEKGGLDVSVRQGVVDVRGPKEGDACVIVELVVRFPRNAFDEMAFAVKGGVKALSSQLSIRNFGAATGINVELEAGNVELQSFNASIVVIQGRKGLIGLSDGIIDGRVNITSDSGDAVVSSMRAEHVTVVAAGGSVTINDLDVKSGVSAKASGSVTAKNVVLGLDSVSVFESTERDALINGTVVERLGELNGPRTNVTIEAKGHVFASLLGFIGNFEATSDVGETATYFDSSDFIYTETRPGYESGTFRHQYAWPGVHYLSGHSRLENVWLGMWRHDAVPSSLRRVG